MEHPSPKRVDEVGALGERHELARQHEPAARDLQPDQRLETHDLPAPGVYARLVVEQHPILFERPAKRFLEPQAAGGGLLHLGSEVNEAVLAALFAVVHGDVGAPQQSLGAAPIVRVGADADAGRDVHEVLAYLEEVGEGPRGALRQLVGGHPRIGATHQHRELVTAEARQHLPRREAVAQALGNGHQHPVARGVPERVVHRLQVVEVEEQHGQFRLRRGRLGQGLLEELLEVRPVG